MQDIIQKVQYSIYNHEVLSYFEGQRYAPLGVLVRERIGANDDIVQDVGGLRGGGPKMVKKSDT